MTNAVVHNQAETRYELEQDGHIAIAAYALSDGIASFTHTEVPDQLSGRGVGTALIAGALDDVRQRGWKIRPLCPFVSHFVETHPDAQPLVAR